MKTRILLIVMLGLIGLSTRGQIMFQKTYGGVADDVGACVQQTTDGGYIIAGYIQGFISSHHDVYLIKTNAYGDTLWTKIFGGTGQECHATSVQQTFDGGYIIAGNTTFGVGSNDIYLIRTNSIGDTLWTRTYGDWHIETGSSVQQTLDSGFIISGYTSSFGAGGEDVYLIKSDQLGNVLWTKSFGGSYTDEGNYVKQTIDGGYIITGQTNSFGAGNKDIYLIKTNVNGDTLWTKTYGGTGNDIGYSVKQTNDRGYIITGETNSFGAGNSDAYLVKTDSLGNTLWSKTYGGTNYDVGNSVEQTSDGGYIILGYTLSFGAGGDDVYLGLSKFLMVKNLSRKIC